MISHNYLSATCAGVTTTVVGTSVLGHDLTVMVVPQGADERGRI